MINKKVIGQICIIAAFALIVTGVAVLNRNNNSAELSNKMNTEQPTAGVTLQVSSVMAGNYNITAGVTSEVLSQTFITDVDSDIVAKGQEDDGTFCGYTNLGIANITTGNLNIRKEAKSNAEVIGKMTKHNACEILDENDGWLKIKSGAVKGYVSSEYILKGDKARAVAEKEVENIATVVNTATLRIRSEANPDSSTIQLIGRGEEMVIIEELAGWYKVEADDDKEGYVSADYVETSQKLPTAKKYSAVKSSNGVSNTRVDLVEYALQFVGNRYVYGGTSLTKGIDCSGFTMKIYARYGVKLPHRAALQPAYGKKIKPSEARPGDLFFYGSGKIGHVAIYIGGGKIVHAANKRAGIKISNAYYSTPRCVVSYLK